MSTAHTHPPHLGGMAGHPSVISASRPLPSPMATLGSPMNGLASPYPVITSSLGSPSLSLPSTPNMNFGQLGSPQVRAREGVLMVCGRLRYQRQNVYRPRIYCFSSKEIKGDLCFDDWPILMNSQWSLCVFVSHIKHFVKATLSNEHALKFKGPLCKIY